MEWAQFVILIVAFVGLFTWNRSESRADIRHMDAKLEAIREMSMQNQKENRNLIDAIQTEMKDFHIKLALQDQEFKMRLCAIEEGRK